MNGHHLASKRAKDMIPAQLRDHLNSLRKLGYTGCTVVPLLFKDISPEDAADIAREAGMQLVSCGFLPGAEFRPHTKDGRQKALDEVERQFIYQQHFKKVGCGGDIVCGPVGQGWMDFSAYDEKGHFEYLHDLSMLMAKMGLWVAVEELNKQESGIPDPFNQLIKAMHDAVGNGRVKAQFDLIHAHDQLGDQALPFFNQNLDQILMVELGMPNRTSLAEAAGIDPTKFFKPEGHLPRGAIWGTEPFDYEGVIKPFAIEHIYGNKRSGLDVAADDAEFLKKHGMM